LVDRGVFRANQIFGKVGLERLDERAEPYRIRKVKTGMVVHSPVPILAHSLADFDAVFIGLPNRLVRVERLALKRVRRRVPEGSKSGVYASSRGFLQTAFLREGSGITLYMAARESAKQVIDRHAQCFALDIPQGQVDRSQGIELLAPCRVKIAAEHRLPQMVDAHRVFADDHRRTLFNRIRRAPFAETR